MTPLRPRSELATSAVGNQPAERGDLDFWGGDRRSGTGAGCVLRRVLLLGLGGLAACARVDLPEVAIPGSGNEGMAAVVEDRVWIDTGSDAPAGSLRAFLSDGTLIMTSCVETYRLAPWRWVEGAMLVWEEDGRSIRAEVALAERNEMVLVIDLGEESLTRHFRAAKSPVVCPELPR